MKLQDPLSTRQADHNLLQRVSKYLYACWVIINTLFRIPALIVICDPSNGIEFLFITNKQCHDFLNILIVDTSLSICWYVPYLGQHNFHVPYSGSCLRPQLYPLCCNNVLIHAGKPAYLVQHSLFFKEKKLKCQTTLSETTILERHLIN